MTIIHESTVILVTLILHSFSKKYYKRKERIAMETNLEQHKLKFGSGKIIIEPNNYSVLPQKKLAGQDSRDENIRETFTITRQGRINSLPHRPNTGNHQIIILRLFRACVRSCAHTLLIFILGCSDAEERTFLLADDVRTLCLDRRLAACCADAWRFCSQGWLQVTTYVASLAVLDGFCRISRSKESVLDAHSSVGF